MSIQKSPKFIKYCIITSTTSIVFIAISLIPLSKKSFYWNRCFSQTVKWIKENEMDLRGWEKEAIESLAVAVCNGAVYEPKMQSN